MPVSHANTIANFGSQIWAAASLDKRDRRLLSGTWNAVFGPGVGHG